MVTSTSLPQIEAHPRSALPLLARRSLFSAVVALGCFSLSVPAQAQNGNTAYGPNALLSNTTGDYNSAFGYNALENNQDGSENTAVGVAALASQFSGSGNTAVGSNAAVVMFGNDNTALGRATLSYGLYAAYGSQNTAVGSYALHGAQSANFSYNTATGFQALYAN